MTTECSCPIMRSSWRHRPMRDTGDPAAVRRLPAGRGVVPLLAVPEDRGVPPEPAPHLGSLTWLPAVDRPDLVAAPVVAALPQLGGVAWVAEIDDDLADTATFSDAYGVPLEASANCVVVAARRAGQTSLAACVVLATTRADVNGLVRRRLDARKASFAPQDDAVAATGMAFGGITPIGLPDWPVLIDAAVPDAGEVIVGSGIRSSKLLLLGARLAQLVTAEVLTGLGRPAPS